MAVPLLLLAGAGNRTLAQSAPSPLAESGSAQVVCEGEMPDGSGSNALSALTFTPDGHVLLGCRNGSIELRTLDGIVRFRQQPDAETVVAVAVTPDGSRLISATGSTVRVWTTAGEPLIQFQPGQDSSIRAMAISPDGRQLLTGHGDCSGRLWSLDGGLLRRFDDPSPLVRADARVESVAFAPQGGEVAIGHGNGDVRRWSLDGSVLGEIDTDFSPLLTVAITKAGDLVAGGWDGAARWNRLGQPLGSLREEGIVQALHLLPDGNGALMAGRYVDPYLEIRDLNGRLLLSLMPPRGYDDEPVALSADARVVMTGEDTFLSRWDLPASFH